MNGGTRAGRRAALLLAAALGLLLGAPGAAPATAPDAGAPATGAAAAPTYVESLLSAKGTRRSGFAAYVARPATLGGGATFPHALVTEVGGAGESQTLSVLSLGLDRRYERFEATIGREPVTSDDGAAGAFFEVWGDGDCLFRSAALYPARGRRPEAAAGAAQPVSVGVRGVRTLQLVTRYAAEAAASPRRGGTAPRASGCVWAAARLVGAAEAAGAVTPPPAAPTGAPVPDLRRDAVRLAALRLAADVAGTPAPGAATTGGAAPALPLRVALLPLRPCARTASSRRRRGTWTEPADAAVQETLRAALPSARRGSAAVFDLLDEKATGAAARALPGPTAAGVAPPTAADLLPVREECLKAGAEAVAVATIVPGETGSPGAATLDVKLFDVRSGALIADRAQPLPHSAAPPRP